MLIKNATNAQLSHAPPPIVSRGVTTIRTMSFSGFLYFQNTNGVAKSPRQAPGTANPAVMGNDMPIPQNRRNGMHRTKLVRPGIVQSILVRAVSARPSNFCMGMTTVSSIPNFMDSLPASTRRLISTRRLHFGFGVCMFLSRCRVAILPVT